MRGLIAFILRVCLSRSEARFFAEHPFLCLAILAGIPIVFFVMLRYWP